MKPLPLAGALLIGAAIVLAPTAASQTTPAHNSARTIFPVRNPGKGTIVLQGEYTPRAGGTALACTSRQRVTGRPSSISMNCDFTRAFRIELCAVSPAPIAIRVKGFFTPAPGSGPRAKRIVHNKTWVERDTTDPELDGYACPGP